AGFLALCSQTAGTNPTPHPIPAGPPPTMTTSAGICGRSTPSMGLRKISISFSFEFQVGCDANRPRVHELLSSRFVPGIDWLRPFSHLRTFQDFFFQRFKPGLSSKGQSKGNCRLSFQFKQRASCLLEEMTKLASG